MIGILITTVISLILGICLVIVDKKYNNKNKILELLPGYNCGMCGFKGCEGMSLEIMKDPNAYKKCRLLKGDNLIKMEEYINNNYLKKVR